jgi:hypothetical protein
MLTIRLSSLFLFLATANLSFSAPATGCHAHHRTHADGRPSSAAASNSHPLSAPSEAVAAAIDPPLSAVPPSAVTNGNISSSFPTPAKSPSSSSMTMSKTRTSKLAPEPVSTSASAPPFAPSSAVQASSNTGPVGLGINESSGKLSTMTIPGSKLSWYYNWKSDPAPDSAGLEYVPMVWGVDSANSVTANGWKGVTHVLSFNERESGSITVH